MPGSVAPILIRFLICFLIGSIPFAVIAMTGSGIDIRKVGSGNPGFNNVLRVDKRRALLALIGDMGKGYLAVWLVLRAWAVPSAAAVPFTDQAGLLSLGWLCGFGAVFGHCYSPFLKFNGGKGVATSGGVMLALHPGWAAIALAYFTVVRLLGSKLKWREAGTIASLTTWVVFAALMLAFVSKADAGNAAIMLLFLVWRHKKNLHNLMLPRAPEPATLNLGTNVEQPKAGTILK
jgi:glycerol-3-phosphate acyltransferase PlsY